MTRSIFVAALALTPALLHAQAKLPAQTVLLAHALPVAAIRAAAPKDFGPKIRISTGIVAPRLLNAITLASAAGLQNRMLPENVNMVVTLTVDATGKPSNIEIAQPTGTGLDQQVVAALSQARFQPGTLDGEAYTLPVRLNVIIERGSKY